MEKKWLVAIAMMAICYQVSASKCPEVDCDCDAIANTGLQESCKLQQSALIKECIENKGRPLNYCRIHGDNARPLALSIHSAVQKLEQSEVENYSNQTETQYWSLQADLKTLQELESNAAFGDALKLAKLFDKNMDRFFEYGALTAVFLKADSEKKSRKFSEQLAEKSFELGKQLDVFSDAVRLKFGSETSPRNRKAYDLLSTRLARLAGGAFEQSAYLAKLSDEPERSADTWQRAANIAEKLATWEELNQNNPRFVNFYREQASARWYRAGLRLASVEKAKEDLLVVTQNAERARLSFAEKALAEAESDSLHGVDNSTKAAIKR